jgi:hypothetical protein
MFTINALDYIEYPGYQSRKLPNGPRHDMKGESMTGGFLGEGKFGTLVEPWRLPAARILVEWRTDRWL